MGTVNYQGVYRCREGECFIDAAYTAAEAEAELTASEFKIGPHTYAARTTGGAHPMGPAAGGLPGEAHWVYLEIEGKKAGVIIFLAAAATRAYTWGRIRRA